MKKAIKKLLFIITVFLLLPGARAQNQVQSFSIILSTGDSLREEGNLIGAIEAFKKDIAAGDIYAADDHSPARSAYFANLYNLACAYSRTSQEDSSLKYLELYVQQNRDSSNMALTDPDFINLRSIARWEALENRIISNYCAKNKIRIRKPDYAKALWYMLATDQAYYQELKIAEQKTGRTSAVIFAIWDLKRKLNDDNQRQLEALINEKGWPKISEVGERAAGAAFLVIQHANLAKQEKYLPVLERMCQVKEARWADYALMYDRIQTSRDQPQRYGSQVRYNSKDQKYELFPLEDASKVDEWRREAGLQPLAEYVSRWNIVWPVQK